MSEDMQTNMQQTTFKLDNDFHVFSVTFLCKGCQGSYCLMTTKELKMHGGLNLDKFFGDNGPGRLWATKIKRFFHDFKCEIWPPRSVYRTSLTWSQLRTILEFPE